MAELAADACGPKKHGSNCGIAYVSRLKDGPWFADCKALEKQLDATALELQAVEMGMAFLSRQLEIEAIRANEEEVIVYSDASRLFDYLGDTPILERHRKWMKGITDRVDYLEDNRIKVTFKQVFRQERENYPLYMMADALSRHARTLDVGDSN